MRFTLNTYELTISVTEIVIHMIIAIKLFGIKYLENKTISKL